MQTNWQKLTPNLNLNEKHKSLIHEIAHCFFKTGTGVPDRQKRIELGKDRALLNELTQHGLISNIANKYYPAFPSLFFLDEETRDSYAQAADWVFRALKDLYVREGSQNYDAGQIHKEVSVLVGRVVDGKIVRRGMLFTQDFRNYFVNFQTSPEGPITSVGAAENIIDYEDLLQAWQEELPSRPALANREQPPPPNPPEPRSPTRPQPPEPTAERQIGTSVPPKELGNQFGPSTHVARDRWTTEDSLGHFPYAYAIYRFLTDSATQPPLAISIQAPWGGGKTSLMRMIQAQLDPEAAKRAGAAPAKNSESSNNATVGQVLCELSTVADSSPNTAKPPAPPGDRARFTLPAIGGDGERRVTIWFNVWKYESTAQVWSGLADCIVQQIGERLGPVERELFWFRLHLRRVDADKIRLRVYQQIATRFFENVLPWLRTYLIGPALAIGMFLAGHLAQWAALRNTGLIGLALTICGDIFFAVTQAKTAKTKVEGESARASLGDLVSAPDYRANLGFVHEVVEDLKKVFETIPQKYLPMVIFIDDLDRCSPGKVAAVVEAINLFLAGEFPDCMFILGIDDEMVAAALDEAHSDVIARLPGYAKSASIGWRFMDKFVQLPFIIPPSSEGELTRYIESLLAQDGEPREVELEARDQAARLIEKNEGNVQAPEDVVREVSAHRSLAADQKETLKNEVKVIQEMDRNIKRFNDQESELRELIFPCAKQYFSNPREAKRLVNLFRFYYFLRAARESRGEQVPSVEQMLRWLILSLKWPEVVRWLRRATRSHEVYSSLGILERLGAGCQNMGEWQTGVEKELALKSDQTPWLSDEGLLQFFQAESALTDLDRLSMCGGMGLW